MNPNTLIAIQLAITLLNRALEAIGHNVPISDDELDDKQKEVDDVVDKLKRLKP